ncbi:MAG: PLP-dependent cysteine synthase family protein [Planctomycetota bacterium]|nr:PLP-dependent cysteine synthase family protein [Planctomycetota bacterium]
MTLHATPAPHDELVPRRVASLRRLIGGTPMVSLRCAVGGLERTVHAKLEVRNLTGSIKDRMALHILEHAHRAGEAQRGDTIFEATSGNTGISFAAVGRALGHDVRIYMPDWMSPERVHLIRSLGATVIPISHEEGGFVGAIARAESDSREHEHAYLPRQFENDANVAAHESTTGPEILAQLEAAGLQPTGFVAGVGTGGTVMGVGRYLRRRVPGCRVHPLEPANSPTLRTGKRVGKHRIQGISDEFVPAIVDLERLDGIVDVWDGDAILMAQRLATELGLAVGISSGANLLGALQVALDGDDDACVATVFADSNKKYLSTDLCRDEPARPEYLSSRVELLGCEVLPGLEVVDAGG